MDTDFKLENSNFKNGKRRSNGSGPGSIFLDCGPLNRIPGGLADGLIRIVGSAVFAFKRGLVVENSPELSPGKAAGIGAGCMAIHIEKIEAVIVFGISGLDAAIEYLIGSCWPGFRSPLGIEPAAVGGAIAGAGVAAISRVYGSATIAHGDDIRRVAAVGSFKWRRIWLHNARG